MNTYIKNEELLNFVETLVSTYGTDKKEAFSHKVADTLERILDRKKLLVPGVQQMFIEVLFAAAYVHNLFYDESDLTSLFALRQSVYDNAANFNMDVVEAVLQTVESQLGEDSPVPMCKPSVNSPTEVFALAVWIAKNYDPIN